MEAGERARRPPVPAAEQGHQRRDEQGADDERVDQDARRGGDADLLDEGDRGGDEGADRDGEQDRGGGDDRAGALDADRDRLAVAEPAVARLLDPPEQEDAVVGREREDERGGDEEVGRLDAAVAGVAEQALEAAVLEDEREDAERRRRRSARS